MTFDRATIAATSKVLLHDHLDGGLRPSTIVDLAAETGYAEVRFAPELLTRNSLSPDDVVRAALAGFASGSAGSTIIVRVLVTAMRESLRPSQIAASSNVHTGAVERFDAHPVPLLRDLGFPVTVNTDNRLMSGVSLSDEWGRLHHAFGFGPADLQELTLAALDSAFCSDDERERLRAAVIEPALAADVLPGQP